MLLPKWAPKTKPFLKLEGVNLIGKVKRVKPVSVGPVKRVKRMSGIDFDSPVKRKGRNTF